MTKVGEGGQPAKPAESQYQTALQGNIVKFQNALASRDAAQTDEERAHLDEIMKQQMSLIQANVREIKRAGIQKQGEVVASDYERFANNPNPQNKTALQQDISTLKEYSLLPE